MNKDLAKIQNEQLVGFLQAKLALVIGVILIFLTFIDKFNVKIEMDGIPITLNNIVAVGFILMAFIYIDADNKAYSILYFFGYRERKSRTIEGIKKALKEVWKKYIMSDRRSSNRRENLYITDFGHEVNFVQILVIVSTLLVALKNPFETNTFTFVSNTFFIGFVVLIIAYYFMLDFGFNRKSRSFLLITFLAAVCFAATIGLEIGVGITITSGAPIASIYADAYIIIVAVVVFLVLTKPISIEWIRAIRRRLGVAGI